MPFRPPPKSHIRVLVADDHVGLAASLTASLADSFPTLPAVNSLAQLARALDDWKTEVPPRIRVVVLDVSFGHLSAILALPQLTADHPDVRFVMYSAHFSEVLVDAALRSGALGYVDKCCGLTELRRAIVDAAADKRAVFSVAGEVDSPSGQKLRPLRPLTPALHRLLGFLQAGKSRREACEAMGVTLSAVEADVTRLRKAFGLAPHERVDWKRCSRM